MERIATLVEWATSRGTMLHPAVEVFDDPTTGLSFRVKPSSEAALAPWETVVSLPTSLSLSFINAISPAPNGSQLVFHAEILGKTKPHVIGRLFLIKQYLLGQESFWWPYIQSLPQPDDADSWALPPFWPADEAELLEGTNVEVGLDKIRADVGREFSEASDLLKLYGDDKDKSITMSLYKWAYSIFSSRSFRPSLVLADQDLGQVLPEGVGIDDFSVLLPLFDIGNHDMTADVKWELRRDDSQTNGRGSRCELSVGQEFRPGDQVYNNYSMKTNAELLLGYGFMIPPTEDLHNDYTHVRKRTNTPKASEEYYISRRPMAHHSSRLGQYRQTLSVDLPEEKPMVGAFRHVQPDMAWDIFCALTQPQEREQLIPSDGIGTGADPEGDEAEREKTRQRKFFSGDLGQDSPASQHLEHTMAIIQHKVMQELERLDETDVDVAPGEEAALTNNQRLALEYRKRCRAVLENTLEAMEAEEEEQV